MPENNSCRSILSNLELMRSIEERASNARSFPERIADAIGAFCGSMTFVLLHILIFGGWITINLTNIPGLPKFDPYPFLLLSVSVSLEAIFLATFVLMKQNRMSRRSEARAALDLQINLLAEKEMTLVLRVLRRMSEHMQLRDVLQDPELRDLALQTPVEAVAEELQQTVND
jgi:uncharacterized membrane protein